MDNYRKRFSHILGGVRGKNTQQKPECLTIEYVAILKDFLELQKYVTLVSDIMFVNNTPFLITMSRVIKGVTVEHIPSRTAKHLRKS